MPCFSPLQAYRSANLNSNGKRPLVFDVSEAINSQEITIPCGRCTECQLRRSRDWAVRCVLEASMYERNSFISLTYDDYFLPYGNTLVLSDFQKFMKRLRKKLGNGIKFFHCGEYGDKHGRPHYHAILFGVDFDDKYFWKMSNGLPLYRSDVLEKLWPFGHSSIGSVTVESAAYVARYSLKKKFGIDSWIDYVDEETGVIKQPEYITMSQREGIGSKWFQNFYSDVYPNDVLIVSGKKLRPPKYFDKLLEKANPEILDEIKASRLTTAFDREVSFCNEYPTEMSRALRLDTIERAKLLSVKRLVRVLDSKL